MNNSIAHQFNYLQRLLAQLEIQMLRQPCASAQTYAIPPTKPKDEHKPVTSITPHTLSGRNAVLKTIECYKDLHLISGLSKKYTRQTFGHCFYPTVHSEALGSTTDHLNTLIDLVHEINNTKKQIRQYITENYPTRNARFQAMKEQCPATMTLHIYRNIKIFINEDIKAINYTWVNQDDLKRTTRAQLIEQINKLIETSDNSTYINTMNQLASSINSIPDDKLRLRRAISRPQPCVNITYLGNKKATMTHVPMPIVVIQQTMPTQSKPVKPYELKERKTRSDRLKTSVLTTLNGFKVEVLN